ncbi:hypothetical protein QJS66_13835 [Kocuria rhizophila]|nr:hypothetical protein QJS66_13835 [Kocuria rhizophila]
MVPIYRRRTMAPCSELETHRISVPGAAMRARTAGGRAAPAAARLPQTQPCGTDWGPALARDHRVGGRGLAPAGELQARRQEFSFRAMAADMVGRWMRHLGRDFSTWWPTTAARAPPTAVILTPRHGALPWRCWTSSPPPPWGAS